VSARDNILARIRANLGRPGPTSEADLERVRAVIAQHPTGPRVEPGWPDDRAQFKEQAIAMASTIDEVGSLAEVPAAAARFLAAGGLSQRGVCWPELAPLDWTAAGLEIEARPARGDDVLGITGAFCAVAETGTLILASGPDTSAATSLLPETHIAVVSAARIVRDLEAAWALLRRERGTFPRAVNCVSGPSRTADIEQTLVLGAHGPYRVHILLIP